MESEWMCQGRKINADDLTWLRRIIGGHEEWSRFRIANELCRQWNWKTGTGQYKTFAARELLLKLEGRELIHLPPVRKEYRNNTWSRAVQPSLLLPESAAIEAPLSALQPLNIIIPPRGSAEDKRFEYYLSKHHYLGFRKTVGESMKYLVMDRQGRDLACMLFGSAAWKTAPRDAYIGWSDEARRRNVNLLTNNTRCLILPWVRVPHLASHVLGTILRRLRADWQTRYGHPIHLVETFVERDRFRGTCYKAANWICVGATKGRSRQDRDMKMRVPVKDIHLYPLIADFREDLCRVYA